MGEDADLEETKFGKWVAEKFGDKGTNFIMAVAAVLGGVLGACSVYGGAHCAGRGCWRGSCRWGLARVD